MSAPIGVGDLVRVGRACMDNPAGALAVCYETYTLGGDNGVGLLLSNGAHDGFSPRDLVIWGVQKIGHAPELAGYRFRNVMQLTADFRRGHFAAAFRDAEDGQ